MAKTLNQQQAEQYLDAALTIFSKAAKQLGIDFTRHIPYGETFHLTRGHWAAYEEMIREINYQDLTKSQQKRLRRHLEKTVHFMDHAAAILLATRTPIKAWNYVQKKIDLTAVHNFQVELIKTTAARQVAALDPAHRTHPNDRNQVTFPKLAQINLEVDTAVAALQQKWQTATTRPDLNTEDTYLLAQITTAYLPDAWRMYENLRTTNRDIQRQGAAMLLTQVQALTQQVDSITGAIGDDTLKQLRAHTVFITSKQQAAQPAVFDLR